MLSFPDSPTLGQIFPPYTWDGEKWTNGADPLPLGDPPDDTNPLVNGVNIPGIVTKYSRGDHVHPTDTSRVVPNNASLTNTTNAEAVTITGDITISGVITSRAKGHSLGTASGTASPPLKSEANIIFYDAGGDNWAGMGSDNGGNVWIRTGLTGTPGPALFIDQARNITFLKSPIAPTPGAGDNSTKIATTAFVLANPASGPFVLLSGGTMTGMLTVANGDWRVYRSDGTGVVFLNNTGDRYIYYNGSSYQLPGAHAYSSNGRLWGSGDFPAPIVNIRMAYLGDLLHAFSSGLNEPYGGGCTTGSDGYSDGVIQRYRQFQIQIGATWYAVAYA